MAARNPKARCLDRCLTLESIGQRRFTDARLPRHEHNLALAPQRFPKAIAQRAQLSFSSDQFASSRLCWDSRWNSGAVAHSSDKPVSTPMQSLNKKRRLRPVAQRFSEIENEFFDGLRLDVSIWPDRIEQLIVRHEASGALHQMAQHCEGLGRQQDALVGALIGMVPKTLVYGVEPEWRKLFHNHALARGFSSPASPIR